MDANGHNSHFPDSTGSESCKTRKEDENSSEKNNSSCFVNHAEIAWVNSRKAWIGDQSQKSKRRSRELVMSWSITYEELFSSKEPFNPRIPLAEMVDFLVDIWSEEGLYD